MHLGCISDVHVCMIFIECYIFCQKLSEWEFELLCLENQTYKKLWNIKAIILLHEIQMSVKYYKHLWPNGTVGIISVNL